MLTIRRSDNLSGSVKRLIELLDRQFYEEIEEVEEYYSIAQRVKDPFLKTFFDNIALDTSKHAAMLNYLISFIKEGRNSLNITGLSHKELQKLLNKERESSNVYRECLEYTDNELLRLLIKELIMDEDLHFKLVAELLTLCENNPFTKYTHCDQCNMSEDYHESVGGKRHLK